MRLSLQLALGAASVVAAGVLAAGLWLTRPAAAVEITVYKSPTCGCCSKWVQHLEQNGFKVVAHDVGSINALKAQFSVPPAVASCHTAVVGDYVVEGHVPADLIQRLLKERPRVKGLAVPRMPQGSPGMEGPNPERYDILTFDAGGSTAVYATRDGAAAD